MTIHFLPDIVFRNIHCHKCTSLKTGSLDCKSMISNFVAFIHESLIMNTEEVTINIEARR